MKKHPRLPIRRLRSVSFIPGVIGEPKGEIFDESTASKNRLREFAIKRKCDPTLAEAELERILNNLNNGVLKGEFVREWPIGGRWILDFFFPKVKLAIEVDGSFHRGSTQIFKDFEKSVACRKIGIVLIRITNPEVFGDRRELVTKLRDAYRKALKLKRGSGLASQGMSEKSDKG